MSIFSRQDQFAAQEFLITDGKDPVDEEAKSLFKNKMDDLIKCYGDNLFIIGTILSKKEIVNEKTNVTNKIKLHNELSKHFPAFENNSDLEEYKKIQNYDFNDKKIYSVRNSAIFFSKDAHKTVDKKAINLEDVDNEGDECFFLIQPAKTTKKAEENFLLSNSNPIVLLKYKDFKDIPIGIEICKDHNIGLLNNYLKKHNDQPSPVIHFILSATVEMNEKFLCGQYSMYIDSKNEPVLKKNDLDSKFSIDFEKITINENNCPNNEHSSSDTL